MKPEVKIIDDYDILKDYLLNKISAAEFVTSIRELRETEDADFEIVKPLLLSDTKGKP